MIARILPGKARGTAVSPPSKSMAHRLLIAASLAGSGSRVENLSLSEDILATADCLKALGIRLRLEEADGAVSARFEGKTELPAEVVLPVRESGSTLRFLIPTALSLGRPVTFTGAKRLFERPLSVYENIAREEGFLFQRTEDSLTVSGSLRPKSYRIEGNISSQFVSGLLFALPMLQGESRIELIPPVESRPYIDMTMQALRDSGIESFWEEENVIRVPGNQRAEAKNSTVEGDYSNAAFLEVLNFFGGEVKVTGLREDSLQGDRVYREHFEALRKGSAEIDLSDCPDLAPVLFAAAAAMHGGVFTGTARLRMKESDRAAAMEEELLKFGVKCRNEENRFTVPGGRLRKPEEILNGHNDHRIVMALTSLLTVTGGRIDGAEAVRKSWPGYFTELQKLGIEVECDAVDQ